MKKVFSIAKSIFSFSKADNYSRVLEEMTQDKSSPQGLISSLYTLSKLNLARGLNTKNFTNETKETES
jgi:hypothetical protein